MISPHRQEEPQSSAAPYRQTQGTDSVEHLSTSHDCWHPRLIPGLDRSFCPDCHRSIKDSSDRTPMQTWHVHADMPTENVSGAILEQSDPDAENPCPEPDLSNACGCKKVATQSCSRTAPETTEVSGAVLEQSKNPFKQTAPESPKNSGAVHWTEVYKTPKCKQQYYRYMWMEGRYLRHTHILGGNIKADLAKERLVMVENAIASGLLPDEIVELIKTWGKSKTVSEPMKPPMTRTQIAWALSNLSPEDFAWAVGAANLSDAHLQMAIQAMTRQLAERHQ